MSQASLARWELQALFALASCVLIAACGAVQAQDAERVLEGRASYYSDTLAGHTTANGETYDPGALTAASRDLPFGTRVRVIRVDTGETVTVRINDRGPFGDRRRILDLSRAAAEQLSMIRAGVVEIRAEVLAAN
ncbi:MAG: septal ring lytic transglycosylase RlpA family protein [Sandaracinaceae bacterium]